MADRYWVGGTGTWDGTSTTNWSASSGGATGASVPTAADNVFFDANSNVGTGAFTVTMAVSPRVCNDFTASGLDGMMTLAGTGIGLTVSGSLDWPSTNFTRTYTGTTTFNATTTGKTITARVAFNGAVTFDGAGGGWTLGAVLNTTSQTITITRGTFDTSTSNFGVICGGISSSNSNARTINFNGSLISTSLSTAIGFSTSTNLTFNAGTSTINVGSTVANFNGGNQTFYNVSFTSGNASNPSISGTNTFNNLTFASRTSTGITEIDFFANQTINGTLTLNAGTASAYRTMLSSSTIGTQRTLTCAAIVGGTDYDFRDINIDGAASPIAPTRAGDCGGNNGITFPAAKTVYYRATGSANWGATVAGVWSATSGGAADATQFPLAQDTAVFPAATYPASGATTSINDNYNIGTIDMSLRTTNTMGLASPNSLTIYGNWINGTGITISGTGAITFAGRTTQQLTSAGRSFTQAFTVNSPSGTVQLQDAFTTGTTVTTNLFFGTLDLQSYTLSTGLFNSSNSNTRTIAFGTGQISCTGTGTVWTTASFTGLTTTGTQVVNVTFTGSTAIAVNSGNLSEANTISFNFTGGNYPLTFANQVVRSINFTGYAGTWGGIGTGSFNIYGDLIISSGMTITAGTGTLQPAGSAIKNITTNGKTLDFAISLFGAGIVRLQDALTMGSTRTMTLNFGTLDLNGKTLTVGTRFTTATGTKNLTFNGGTLVCPIASTTSFNNAAPTGFTTTAGTGTGTISMTAATAKNFVGGGSTYNCTLNQGGAGGLTITGSNTFSNITNTVNGTTVLFQSATTNIFTNFNLSGALASLVTLGATATIQATLQKGSTWFMGANSTDSGNNTGLTFTAGGGIDYLNVSYINGTVVAPASGIGGQFFAFF